MSTAADNLDFGFDLKQLTLSSEADTGKWFTALKGKMEFKVTSTTSKGYKRNAVSTMRRLQKTTGKDMNELPLETLEDTTASLLAKNALRGWSTLVPQAAAEKAGLASRTTYNSDGKATPDGFVLIDYAIYDGKPLEFTVDNAKKLLESVPDVNEEVSSLAGNKEQFYAGGADSLD